MRTSPRGFVLPTTLMVMALLTVMLTAAFILISAEYRTTDNALGMSRAHVLAQAGLENYMSKNPSISGASTYDSLHVVFGTGYADVVAQRLVAASGNKPSLWVIRSTGVLTQGGTLTGQTTARRVIAQLAVLNPGTFPVLSAFVAANPVVLIGSGGSPINGNDACTGPGSIDTVGLTIASGDLTGSGVKSSTTPIRPLASHSAVLDSTHIDWAAILAGAITPDYVVPPWPGTMSGTPVVYSAGNLTLPVGTRAGVLIVKGDLLLGSGGNTNWDGVVLVGGRIIEVTDQMRIRGTLTTGLNNLITPNSVLADTINRSGGADYRWDSCKAATQIQGLGTVSPLRNGYISTWSTY